MERKFRNNASPEYRHQHALDCGRQVDTRGDESFKECRTGCGFFRPECQFVAVRAALRGQGLLATCLPCRTQRGKNNARARERDRTSVMLGDRVAARSRSASPARRFTSASASASASASIAAPVAAMPPAMIEVVNQCITKPRHSLLIHKAQSMVRLFLPVGICFIFLSSRRIL